MAVWQHFKINNINNTGVTAEVYALHLTVASTTVSSLGSSSVYNSSFQGVNGTFFGGSELYGIAIADGASVRPGQGGLKNGNANVDRNRYTMYATNSGTVGIAQVVYASDLPGGYTNKKWAIGGLGLYLNETLTKAQYDQKINEEGATEGVGPVNARRPRTLLGYAPNGIYGKTMILAAVFDHDERDDTDSGIRFYDGRVIMSGLGCTMGIHLDGGGSSSIRLIDQPQDVPSRVIRHRTTTTAQRSTVRDVSSNPFASRVPSTFEDIW